MTEATPKTTQFHDDLLSAEILKALERELAAAFPPAKAGSARKARRTARGPRAAAAGKHQGRAGQ